MLKDKFSKVVKVGDWLADTDGVYEVIKLWDDEAKLQEVYFADEDGYLIGTEAFFMVRSEIAKMEIIA